MDLVDRPDSRVTCGGSGIRTHGPCGPRLFKGVDGARKPNAQRPDAGQRTTSQRPTSLASVGLFRDYRGISGCQAAGNEEDGASGGLSEEH